MNRHELINAETETPLGSIVLSDEEQVIFGHDLAEGVAYVMHDSDDDGPALMVGIDPMYRGGLVLVLRDLDGQELHRSPVPELGERPAALTMVGDDPNAG